jgi:tetratricopeptide (TPR) repeat protein
MWTSLRQLPFSLSTPGHSTRRSLTRIAMSTPPSHQPRVNFVHSLRRARDYQPRPQLDQLYHWWRGGAPGVCALVGIGGSGKTAIADRFLRALPHVMPQDPDIPKDDDLPTPANLFVFSFYDVPNPETFFAQLAAWLSKKPYDESAPQPSLSQTLELLQSAPPLLLVLDGLEKVQDDGARGGVFGRIEHGALRELVLRAAEGSLPRVSVLITTRFTLDDLEYAEYAGRAYYTNINIEQLSCDACIALLRRRGVNGPDSDLVPIAHQCGRHALTTDLAGGYIAHFGHGKPGTPLDFPSPEEFERIAAQQPDHRLRYVAEQSARFARLAQRYREGFAESDPAALALLERVCLFRLGVSAELLASVFTGQGKQKTSGPHLAKLTLEQIRAKLAHLTKMRLLESSPEQEDRKYSIHPAVRDGFIEGLDTETARTGHQAAREGLEGALGQRPGGRNPSDPATLDLLEEIVYHTLHAGHPQQAWDIYEARIGQYENLGWRLGAYQRGQRICRAFAADRPPDQAPLPKGLSENAQAGFINEWALYLKDLGRLAPAADCYQRTIDLYTRQEKWENASIANQNLADVRLLQGRLASGLTAAEEALALADRADHAEERCVSYAYRGLARALRGQVAPALDDFRSALHFQHKVDGDTERPLYSGRGIQHTLLLARLGQVDDARHLTQANDKACAEAVGGPHMHFAHCRLLLADLARRQNDLDQARELHDQAHTWAVARDAKELLCWSALLRARTATTQALEHRENNQPQQESQSLDDALTAIQDGLHIARDCGFGIYHIDLLTLRAHLRLLQADPDSAETDARTALFGLTAPSPGTSPYDRAPLDETSPPDHRGIFPPAESALPELLAATHPECGYPWGQADARHALAQALLLRAAQTLGHTDFAPARLNELAPEVHNLINQAKTELAQCLKLRKQIQDPKQEDTRRVIEQLEGGVLTDYPIKREESGPAKAASQSQEGIATMPYERALKRIRHLEELLDIEYEKLAHLEKSYALASPGQTKAVLEQAMKRETWPTIRRLEKELAELLAEHSATAQVPNEEAEAVCAEVISEVSSLQSASRDDWPDEVLQALTEIQQKLGEPGKAAAAKLQVILPIIPFLVSYTLELDTESTLVQTWRKVKSLFRKTLPP